MNRKLSIIVPFVGEYPQVLFTLQSVAQNILASNENVEPERKLDFEIIAIDNYCEEVVKQAITSAQNSITKIFNKIETFNVDDLFEINKSIYQTYENKSGEAVKACSRGNFWLKYLECDYKLSHWEAKRKGVEESSGDILLFLDSHVIPSANSIFKMYEKYIGKIVGKDGEETDSYYYLNGSMHMPLSYKILEWRKLIYKMFIENKYFYSYKFTGYRVEKEPYELSCMSTCGMMISKKIYNSIGGWPKEMYMYGGGENFINYTLGVCGFKKWIFPEITLFHHGEKRDYHYTYDGLIWNRMIAHYLFGGKDCLLKYKSIVKGKESVLCNFVGSILSKFEEHRNLIKSIQCFTIEEYINREMEKS